MTAMNDGARWQAEIDRRLNAGDVLEFALTDFATATGTPSDRAELAVFLNAKVDEGAAERIEALRCPTPHCGARLSAAGAPYASCPTCLTDYETEGLTPETLIFYRLPGELSRDIRWMFVIHGMNSRAPWQEDFSWRIANELKYSAPVLIHKYGWATVDVLVSPMHRRLAKSLGRRMRAAADEAEKSCSPRSPDIIAHSFGTRLFQLVLEDPEFGDLTFGRLITAGSIVRPDFDWDRHIATGRIEAVLNHVGGRDKPVLFAQWAIPGSGPGGRKGYISGRAINVREATFGHSTFFERDKLNALIAEKGLWHDFLTHPLPYFQPADRITISAWWPVAPFLSVVPRIAGLIIFVIFGAMLSVRSRD